MPQRDFDRRRAEFDRSFNRMERRFSVLWVLASVLSSAAIAVTIWAVVRVVLHFT